MKYSLDFKSEAKSDLIDAFGYYEILGSLGNAFLADAERTFSRILAMPTAYRVIHDGIRSLGMRKYPFNIYYLVERDSVIVIAVMHQRRNPQVLYERF